MYHLRAGKPGLHPNLTCVHGDRGCGNTIPGDVAETRAFASSMPKATCKSKRLATRDTLHGSRPNLRQRDPDGLIVTTPSDFSDKGASTKRCARRKKKETIRLHIGPPRMICRRGLSIEPVQQCRLPAVVPVKSLGTDRNSQ